MTRKVAGYKWGTFVLAAVTVLLGANAVREFMEPGVWSPLGPYPTQQVLTAQPISLAATTHVDVVGTKCAADNTPVEGVVRWQSVTPGGSIVVAAIGSSLAAPTDIGLLDKFGEAGGTVTVEPITGRRCFTRLFENTIPAEVREHSVRWLTENKRVAWIITGTETPSDGKREGVSVVWSTEPFEIVE